MKPIEEWRREGRTEEFMGTDGVGGSLRLTQCGRAAHES
jgi:hypothetical protein